MSTLATNAITDASGGNTATINSYTPTESNMAGRNLIINGDMRVAQRGTVATGGSTGLHYGGPDRWRMYQENTAVAYTLSQDTNAPDGFGSSFKIDVTTADATVDAVDRVDFIYRFEGQELQQIAKGTANATTMTLSFWVSSPKTGTHIVEFFDNDNSRQVSIPYTVNAANTWEKKELLVPADTVGTFDNGVNLSLQISWWLMAGSNYSGGTLSTSWSSVTGANRAVGQVNVFDNTSNNFYLTGVQLEAGSVATPFERRQYGQELALCQRYYEKSYDAATVPGTATTTSFGNAGNTGQSDGTKNGCVLVFKVPKRASANMAYWDGAGTSNRFTTRHSNTWYNGRILTAVSAGENSAVIDAGTGVQAPMLVHYTASAEV